MCEIPASDGSVLISIWTEPAGRQAHRGGLRSAWHSKKHNEKIFYPYGNILWTFLASAA